MKSLNLKHSILAAGATLILAGASAAQTERVAAEALAPPVVPQNRCTITEIQVKGNVDNFAPPAGNRSAANFGTITSTFDARQVQLGLKVLW